MAPIFRWPWARERVDPGEIARQAAEIAARDAAEKATVQTLERVDEVMRTNWAHSPMQGAPPPVPTGPGRHPIFAWDKPYTFVVPQTPQRRPGLPITIETMRQIADTYDVYRACVNHIRRECTAIPVKFVAKDGSRKSASQSRRIKEMDDLLAVPGGLGGRGVRRTHFENALIEDLLVIGVTAVWYHYKRGGDLYEVLPIDGATIRPKIDPWGWPGPGDKVYEQWVYGLKVADFDRKELRYDGIWSVSYSPFPCSPIQWLVNTVNSALQADQWNRTWLTHGTSPSDAFALPETWTPAEIREYGEWFKALMEGDSATRQRTMFLPGGSQRLTGNTRKDQDFQEFELWLLRRTCAVMGVSPASIGFAGEQYKVSQEASMRNTTEYGIGVVLEWRKEFYDDLAIRRGYDDIESRNVTSQYEEATSRATRLGALVDHGLITINEARAEDGRDPYPSGYGDVPLVKFGTISIDQAMTPVGGGADTGSGEEAPVEGEEAPPDQGDEEQVPGQDQAQQTSAVPPGPTTVPPAPPPPQWDTAGAQEEEEEASKSRAQRVAFELSQWEKKSLRRLRSGKPPTCKFQSYVLPEWLVEDVCERLPRCQSGDDVHNLFRGIGQRVVAWITKGGRHVPITATDGEGADALAQPGQQLVPPPVGKSREKKTEKPPVMDKLKGLMSRPKDERNPVDTAMLVGTAMSLEPSKWTWKTARWTAPHPEPFAGIEDAMKWAKSSGHHIETGDQGDSTGATKPPPGLQTKHLSALRQAGEAFKKNFGVTNSLKLRMVHDIDSYRLSTHLPFERQTIVNTGTSMDHDESLDRNALSNGGLPFLSVPGLQGVYGHEMGRELWRGLSPAAKASWGVFYGGTHDQILRAPSHAYRRSSEEGFSEAASAVAFGRPMDPLIRGFIKHLVKSGKKEDGSDGG